MIDHDAGLYEAPADLREIADGMAAFHAAAPEVLDAGGAVAEDADGFEDTTLADALRGNGLAASAEAIGELRDRLRDALREIQEDREEAEMSAIEDEMEGAE